jgi:MATE family multidrug resistance protein
MLNISIPSSFAQLFFALGMTAFMSLLARASTQTAAASKVLMDLVIAGLLPALGFGMAGTTLVSQALGAKDHDDARLWGWQVARVAFVCVTLIALPVALFPEAVLGGLLKDQSTLELARTPLRLVAFTIGFDAVGMVLQNCLLGAGDSRRVMVATLLTQWVVLLPLVAFMVLVLHMGMREVWTLQVSYRILLALVFAYMWRQGRWSAIRV